MPGRLRTASRPLQHLDAVGVVFVGVGKRGRGHGGYSDIRRGCESATSNNWALPTSGANISISVPVIQACAPSSRISSNRAARRVASRCAAISSQQQKRAQARARPRQFARVGKHDGDEQRLLLPGGAFARVGAFSGCGGPRDRSGAGRRSCVGFRVADARPGEVLAQRSGIDIVLERKLGGGEGADPLFERPVQPSTVSTREAAIAMPASTISASSPSSHAGSRGRISAAARVRALRSRSASPCGHGWRRSRARGGREFAPSARAFDEQAVHRRRQPEHLHDVAEIGGALRLRRRSGAPGGVRCPGRRRGRCRSRKSRPRAPPVAATATQRLGHRRRPSALCARFKRAPRSPRPGDRSEIASRRIGLAGAVGPAEHDGHAARRDLDAYVRGGNW